MDRGYEISMKPEYSISILKNGEIIANTVREDKLYRLETTIYIANIAKKAHTIKTIDIETLYMRLGHLGEDDIQKLAKMSTGIEIKPSTLKVCHSCLEGKQHHHSVHTPAQHRATELLGRIHSDSSGRITPTSVGGAKYYQLYIDDASRWTTIVPLKGMMAKESLECFKEFKAEAEKQLEKEIKILRTDGGGEYEKEFIRFLKQEGIIHEITAPYSPDQNDVAERANHTIMERVKAILADSRLSKELWMEIANTVVYLKNRSPTAALDGKTPYEVWYGEKPDLSHLRILGCTAYVEIPKEKRVKLDSHSDKGYLIGYGGTNQWRIWVPSRNDVIVSRDVIFNERKGQEMIIEEATAPVIHDTIEVLPGPPPVHSDHQVLTSRATE